MNRIQQQKRRLRKKERGMAMMIVMMLLLLMSSTAIFGVHSTSFEMRAAGLARQAVQTQYIAEAGLSLASVMVDQMGPVGAMMALERSRVQAGRLSAPGQPTSAHDASNLHLDARTLRDVTAGSLLDPVHDPIPNDRTATALPATDQVYGNAMTTDFSIDINDSYAYNVPIVGSRVDGGGNLQYLLTVVTATGSLMPAGTALTSAETSYWNTMLSTGGATPSTTTVASFAREFHRTQSVARSVFVTGPFGR